MEELFTVQKRFQDNINTTKILVLDSDMEIFGKTLRAGSILHIIAWREIDQIPYLVVSKGSWESLIPYIDVKHLLKT